MPPLTNASDAVALLTARSGPPDEDALLVALCSITPDIRAWPVLVWQADVLLHLLGQTTDDVPAAVRRLALAVA